MLHTAYPFTYTMIQPSRHGRNQFLLAVQILISNYLVAIVHTLSKSIAISHRLATTQLVEAKRIGGAVYGTCHRKAEVIA